MVRNPSFSRFVRFNAMQTVVLDVLLVLPLIIQRISNPRRGLGFNILVMSYNAVFLFLVLGFLYARVSSMQRESSHDPMTRPPTLPPPPLNSIWRSSAGVHKSSSRSHFASFKQNGHPPEQDRLQPSCVMLTPPSKGNQDRIGSPNRPRKPFGQS